MNPKLMNPKLEKQIFDLLSACMVVQQNYDKKPDQLKPITETWLAVIPPELHTQIPAAVEEHLRQSRCFPTPADILAIIDPKPEYDSAYFRDLLERRKNGEKSFADGEYLSAYRENAQKRANPKPLAPPTKIMAITGKEVKPIALKGMK